MQLPNFCFIVLVLASVFIMGCNGAAHGEACTENSNCTDAYQVCNTTCECDTGYTWSGTKCLAGLGYACTSNSTCSDVNAECTGGLCTCNTTTYYDSNGATVLGTCQTRGGPGAICPDPSTVSGSCIDNAECVNNGGSSFACQCSPGYSDGQCVQNDIVYEGNCIQGGVPCAGDNTECTSGTCQCSSGYYRHNDACVIKVNTSNTCPDLFSGSSVPCVDNNTVCTSTTNGGYTCQCTANYYNNGGTCTQKGSHGVSCPDPNTITGSCVTNAECVNTGSSSYQCQCNTGYSSSGGQCVQNVAYGDTCTEGGIPCAGDNTECTGGKCQCSSGYYRHDDACVTKVNTNNTCPSSFSGKSEPCIDNNAVCTSTSNGYKCQCTTNYYNNGGTCTLKVSLNGICPDAYVSKSLPCKDIHATCKRNKRGQYKCKCKSGFYENGGVCRISKTCIIALRYSITDALSDCLSCMLLYSNICLLKSFASCYLE